MQQAMELGLVSTINWGIHQGIVFGVYCFQVRMHRNSNNNEFYRNGHTQLSFNLLYRTYSYFQRKGKSNGFTVY